MLIRYPGSKTRYAAALAAFYPDDGSVTAVCVPFGGTMSVAFKLLERGTIKRLWYNDIDSALTALWSTVRNHPAVLKQLVQEYVPAVKDFYEFKKNPGTNDIEKAFRKIVLHQISFSGLGAKAGSPIGGQKQTNKQGEPSTYLVGCRWSPNRLCKNINECSVLLQKVKDFKITSESWEMILPEAENYWLSVDPPYYRAGPELYMKGMPDRTEHKRLANALLKRDRWVLSYDKAASFLYREKAMIIDGAGGQVVMSSLRSIKKRGISAGKKRKNEYRPGSQKFNDITVIPFEQKIP
jgi:DNA adenine methylase